MTSDLPRAAADIAETYPEIWRAYEQLGEACANAGGLDENTRRLIKLALAIGAASEGATHSHTRRAVDAGISPVDIKQVAMVAIPTPVSYTHLTLPTIYSV